MKKPKPEDFLEFKSEFHMTQLDFFRLDTILKTIDEYYFRCANLQFKYLLRYLNALKALYNYMRPLLKEITRGDFDKEFKELRHKILVISKLNYETFEEIEHLHEKLMILRQLIGMGVFAKRDIKIAEKDLKPIEELI